MTVTLGQLVIASDALGRLAAERLPIKVAYRVSKLTRAVSAEVAIFHERRNALITACGTQNADGQMWVAPDSDQMPVFRRQLGELAALPVDLSESPLSLESFGDIQISAADIVALGPLVTD